MKISEAIQLLEVPLDEPAYYYETLWVVETTTASGHVFRHAAKLLVVSPAPLSFSQLELSNIEEMEARFTILGSPVCRFVHAHRLTRREVLIG